MPVFEVSDEEDAMQLDTYSRGSIDKGKGYTRIISDPVESYTYTTTLANSSINGWNFYLLNGLAQGSVTGTRVGRQIAMTSMDLSSNAPSGAVQRWVLVYDRQANGALPTGADVFEENLDIRSPQNWSNRHRFDVILDSLFDINKYGYFPLNYRNLPLDLTTTYNSGNTGTITDISSGSLMLGLFVPSAPPQATGSWTALVNYEE